MSKKSKRSKYNRSKKDPKLKSTKKSTIVQNQKSGLSSSYPQRIPWKKIGTYCSLIINVILIPLTVISFLPQISIEPQTLTFDINRKRPPAITIENIGFLPILVVQTYIHIEKFNLRTKNGSLYIDNYNQNSPEIFKIPANQKRTIIYNFNVAPTGPIIDVQSSRLIISVNYRVPFIPKNFNVTITYYAEKHNDWAINWWPI